MKEIKYLCIGLLLGISFCIITGMASGDDAKVYHPVKRVTVNHTTSGDIGTIMRNQEAIYDLIKYRCGDN